MKRELLLAVAAITLALPAFSREWTDISGRKLQAEFQEVEGGDTVVLKLPSGETTQVPLARLIAADQAHALEATPVVRPSAFATALKDKLVALNGTGRRLLKYEMTEEPRHYAFYFSAHWCAPCRTFTPRLVEFYNAQAGKKTDFEIIFVSRDTNETTFSQYIKGDKMPWPAIAYFHARRLKVISKYAPHGIPRLVLVDRDGKVLSDTYAGGKFLGPAKVMNDIPQMTKMK